MKNGNITPSLWSLFLPFLFWNLFWRPEIMPDFKLGLTYVSGQDQRVISFWRLSVPRSLWKVKAALVWRPGNKCQDKSLKFKLVLVSFQMFKTLLAGEIRRNPNGSPRKLPISERHHPSVHQQRGRLHPQHEHLPGGAGSSNGGSQVRLFRTRSGE